MIRFGKPVTSDDFRTDRYFECLFGRFYAMPKGNVFKYEYLGRRIENLYITSYTQTDPAVLAGLTLGILAGAVTVSPAVGALAGVASTLAFADEERGVVVQFADGRCLSIWADRTKLEYLKRKSNHIKYVQR